MVPTGRPVGTNLHSFFQKNSSNKPSEVGDNIDSFDSDEQVPEPIDLFDMEVQDENELQVHPKSGEFWKIRNGTHFLNAFISSENPLVVQYFTPTVKGHAYYLNDTSFDACLEDFHEKIDPPVKIQKGRRTYYTF